MANNKLVDREALKTFRQKLDERYAKPNGYYPTMTTGLADNLTPYGEDSGAEQTNPFISNGTGTNNNTEIVTVGDYGLLKEKQGNTLVVNQLVQNGDFVNTNNWFGTDASYSADNNIMSFTANSQYGRMYQTNLNISNGRKYLLHAKIKMPSANYNARIGIGDASYFGLQGVSYPLSNITDTNWHDIFVVGTYTQNGSGKSFILLDLNSSGFETIQISNVYLVDLTQMFNGDIPQDLLDNPEHFSWCYNGSLAYNTGSLENANGVKLVCTKRQLWDEETVVNLDTIWSKNYIPVVPNKPLYFYCGSNKRFEVYYYDKDYTNVSIEYVNYGSTNITPSNAVFMKFRMRDGYGTTYNHDITISLYYTSEQGGEGYNQYYPYEAPYVVDTGSEVLRKAGSVRDYKEPNGTVHRLVGYVDLGTLNWTYISGNSARFYASLPTIKTIANDNIIFNAICPKYAKATWNAIYAHSNDKTIGQLGGSSTIIGIYDSSYTDEASLKASLSGVYLNYELATETTEQGTPFAENLPINDYGMLYWLDNSNNLVGISQGAKIFYPTNYKGFIDDMYSRVDGDSSQYVIQSELSASETQRDTIDTQLKNAIGGTLRQLLAVSKSIDFLNTDWVDLGKCTITYEDPDNNRIRVHISGLKTGTANILCSAYKSQVANQNGYVYAGTSVANTVSITDSRFTSINVATQLLKGVLLAYEKA